MLNNPSYVIEALIVVALDTPTNFTASAGQGEVTLKWTDPVDKYATPEGETAQDPQQLVAKWSHTLVVRNTDHQPESPDDGTVILTSSVRNQYQTNGYVDNTVVNGTPYYYGVFAISTAGVPSAGAFASATPIAGTPLGELAVGTLIKIQENGAPVEYLIVNQGLPSSMYDASCDGYWVLRKDIAEMRAWDSSNNDYKNSDIHAYLNGSWLSRYSAGVLSQIKQVKIPYHNGIGYEGSVASGANGLSCKIFLLSGYEVGWTTSDESDLPHDGTKLSYFSSGTGSAANNKRIANYNGSATYWWLRSPNTYGFNAIWGVYPNGNPSFYHDIDPGGVRPALILPSTALADPDLNLIET